MQARNQLKASRNRRQRGVILVLGAMLLALGAYAFTLSLETSQKFLLWKMARSRAEAAALAAVLALDGTEAGVERARSAAASISQVNPEQVELNVLADGNALRLRLAGTVSITATARQREIADPVAEPQLTVAAPDASAGNFGLVIGQVYKAKGAGEKGRVVAVQVHSGFPKELPLTWIAGRVVASADGHADVEHLGGYLRGAKHGAVEPHGFFEAALGAAEADGR